MVDAAGTPRRALLKPAEVCDLLKVQPYVLRTWETEFPDLGVSKAAGGPRFYRQADVERAQRIKQLVFAEGLTLAGARRRIEEERAAAAGDLPFDEPFETGPSLTAEARARIDGVRGGLRSLLELLSRPVATAAAASAGIVDAGPAGAAADLSRTSGNGADVQASAPVPAKKKRRRAGASE